MDDFKQNLNDHSAEKLIWNSSGHQSFKSIFLQLFFGKHDYICVPCTLDDFLGLVRASTASGAFTPVMLGWISEILNG